MCCGSYHGYDLHDPERGCLCGMYHFFLGCYLHLLIYDRLAGQYHSSGQQYGLPSPRSGCRKILRTRPRCGLRTEQRHRRLYKRYTARLRVFKYVPDSRKHGCMALGYGRTCGPHEIPVVLGDHNIYRSMCVCLIYAEAYHHNTDLS